MEMDVPSRRTPARPLGWPSIIGVALAMGWPFVFMLFSHPGTGNLGDPRQDVDVLVREWSVTGAVLAIMIFWERLPLASVGLKLPNLVDVGCMFIMMVVTVVGNGAAFAIGSVLTNGQSNAGASVLASVVAIPVGMSIALALTAGICEEFLTRGYAIERLTALTGNRFVGAAVPCLLFTLGHMRLYGFTVGLLPVLATGIAATVLYVWRRSLIVNIAMHAMIDLYGLLLQPHTGRA